MRETRANDVHFEKWTDLLAALESDYTISFKDACKILKASRSWVNKYIRPHIRAVYLNNNNRGNYSVGANYVRIAAMQLGREMSESIWFHREDFEALINSCLVSVTKQTKEIPLTFFIKEEKLDYFIAKRRDIAEEIKKTKSFTEKSALLKEMDGLFEKTKKDTKATKALLNATANSTKRTEVPAVPAELPDDFMEIWEAPHELKDYGDVDETIYRDLFKRGAIRIELQFPSKDGESFGKKVFYINDPEIIESPYPAEGSITVPEEAWKNYKKSIG